MQTYARIEAGLVAELLTTAHNPATLFNPALVWQPVETPGVCVGWLCGPTGFAAPPAPVQTPLQAPTLAELQAELAAIAARITALTTSGG
jgi:DNA-binding XRE family transcriptional regulator